MLTAREEHISYNKTLFFSKNDLLIEDAKFIIGDNGNALISYDKDMLDEKIYAKIIPSKTLNSKCYRLLKKCNLFLHWEHLLPIVYKGH